MDVLFENIKQRRLELGISQSELAKRCGYADRSAIAHIENGKKNLTHSKIIAFAKALDTTPGWLMGYEVPPGKNALDNIPQTKTNVVRIAGRDGTYIEKRLTDEQVKALEMMVSQLPEAPEDL